MKTTSDVIISEGIPVCHDCDKVEWECECPPLEWCKECESFQLVVDHGKADGHCAGYVYWWKLVCGHSGGEDCSYLET